MRRAGAVGLTVTVALVLTLLGGCATDGGRHSIFDQISTKDAAISGAEFEARVTSFADRFPTRIDGVVYELGTADHAHSRAALMLALRASEEAVRASNYVDPMATFVSLITLCYQYEVYFADGDGAAMFSADGRAILVECFGSLRQELAGLVKSAGNKDLVESWANQFKAWADEHPITGETMARPSPTPLFADLKRPSGTSLLAATATIERGMTQLGQRIESMQEQLPRMMVLRTALYIDTLTDGMDVAEFVEQLDRLVLVSESMPEAIDELFASTIEFVDEELAGLDATVARERKALLDGIGKERVAVLDALRGERITIMEALDVERREIMAQVETMRAATVADVDIQRIETLDHMDAMLLQFGTIIEMQRASLTSEIDTTVASAVDASINDLFWMMLKLLVAVLVGLAMLIVFVRILWAPRRVAGSESRSQKL